MARKANPIFLDQGLTITLKVFTPDLTQKQREEAFKLREQKRYRMNELNESGLIIRRGKIVKISDNKGSTVASSAEGLAEGPPIGNM